jgi:hypothetical protein
MAEKSGTPSENADLTTFVTARYYVVGDGETVDEIQSNGRWLGIDDPVEVQR